MNWVERDCGSVWVGCVGNGNSTTISCGLFICVGHTTVKGRIATGDIWIVS